SWAPLPPRSPWHRTSTSRATRPICLTPAQLGDQRPLARDHAEEVRDPAQAPACTGSSPRVTDLLPHNHLLHARCAGALLHARCVGALFQERQRETNALISSC